MIKLTVNSLFNLALSLVIPLIYYKMTITTNGIDALGQYVICLAVAILISSINFGLPPYIIRQFNTTDTQVKYQYLLLAPRALKFNSSVAVILVFTYFVFIETNFMVQSFLSIILLALLKLSVDYCDSMVKCLGELEKSIFSQRVFLLTYSLVFLSVIYLSQSQFSLVIAHISGYFVQAIYLTMIYLKKGKSAECVPSSNIAILTLLGEIKKSVWFFVSSIVAVALFVIDPMILDHFFELEIIGAAAIFIKLIDVSRSVIGQTFSFIFPIVTKYYSEGLDGDSKRIWLILQTVFGGLLVVYLTTFNEIFTTFIFDRYNLNQVVFEISPTDFMIVIAFYAFFVVSDSLTGIFLAAKGLARVSSITGIVQAFFNFSLTIILLTYTGNFQFAFIASLASLLMTSFPVNMYCLFGITQKLSQG
jgi:O-antigen/teichoic acid export membrane protein